MERKEYIQSKKFYLKVLANQIRDFKNELRQYYKDRNALKFEKFKEKYDGRECFSIEKDIRKAKYEFRHQHITYCLVRGRSYEQIEQKVRENNEPNEDYINELLETYPPVSQVDDEKIVCVNS